MSAPVYITYITFYKGNQLPPFYIGSTSLNKYKKGYHGSVCSIEYGKIWKLELKNNPQLFETKIIKSFNDRQSAYDYEEYLQRKLNVVNSTLYINQSLAISAFTNHGKKHGKETKRKIGLAHRGKFVSEETKQKQSNSHKGQRPWMQGRKHSEETKKRISEKVKSIDYSRICPSCGRKGILPSISHHIKKCVIDTTVSL